MVHTAHAMAVAGDRRALDHPFLQRFPAWLVHHFQPGDTAINCFDAGAAYGVSARLQPLLSLLAATTGSPAARWALGELCGGPSDDLAGLAARGLPPIGPDAAPPLFAAYERAARVNWRDSWRDNGSGVWVRGGHRLDQHDHQDRGHVNFIARGRPILIEAGTPSYDNPLMMTYYTPGVGHNVLQLGTEFPTDTADAGELVSLAGWQRRGGIAPITVQRLEATGGEVMVDGTACYDNLAKWRRTVTWSAGELTVTDEVALRGEEGDVVLFRWHLGTTAEAAISGSKRQFKVEWLKAVMSLDGSADLTVSQTMMPDNTLVRESEAKPVHTCLIVHTVENVNELTLVTRVAAR
jgi:hypothetical protein